MFAGFGFDKAAQRPDKEHETKIDDSKNAKRQNQSNAERHELTWHRRTQEEARQLVLIFRQAMKGSPGIKGRVNHLWPTDDVLSDVLYAIAHDIPAQGDPLQLDPVDLQDFTEVVGANTHTTRDSVELREKKTQNRAALLKCVEWLGLVNKVSGHAAVKCKLPGTFEPWVTYVNRMIVYLFAELPDEVTEDFNTIVNAKAGQPLQMKCRNPRCVKLSHMDVGASAAWTTQAQWHESTYQPACSGQQYNIGTGQGYTGQHGSNGGAGNIVQWTAPPGTGQEVEQTSGSTAQWYAPAATTQQYTPQHGGRVGGLLEAEFDDEPLWSPGFQ